MSCNVRTVIASERLYRAEGAHNTTQAVGAVWCMDDVPCRQPLGERQHRYLLQHFLPDDTSLCRLSSTGIQLGSFVSTALHLWLVRCYVRLSARPVSPTLPLALSNYEFSSDPTTHIPPQYGSINIASERLYRAGGAHNTTQAAGAVWCVDALCCQLLGERRHLCSVFEEVFFADGNPILDKECTVLFGKADSAVMLLLSGYIPRYHFAVAHTVCESRVLFGPSVKGWEIRVGFHPFACGHFEVLHEIGHSQCGWERDENMHVVWHTTDTIQLSSDVVDEAKDIRIELALVFYTDGVLTSVSAENDMVQSLCIAHTDVTMNCA